MTSAKEAVDAFNLQASFCEQLGSPFTGRVLSVLAHDIKTGGLAKELLSSFEDEPVAAALALRVAGALHRRVLDDRQCALAEIYPSVGGDGAVGMSDDALRQILVAEITQNRPHYASYLEGPPQTNEVGRSGVMIGGYMTIARETGLPLHVFEIGASAGLNLGCDHFFYRLAESTWGDDTSPVSLSPDWHGALPPLDAELAIVERSGCDIAPVDIRDPENERRLESYIWPDQPDRLARLRGATKIAKALDVKIVQESADLFVERVLSAPAPMGVRVIAHTIMWQYMPDDMRSRIEGTIREAGDAASEASPVAWLRLEPVDVKGLPTLRLNLWPGGETQDLAIAHPHGASVKWL